MANIPENLKYLESHEWAKIEDDGTVTVGISDHAQELLGDIVFVELPQVGSSIEKQADVAVVESVKAASDVYSPVSGEIIATNENLENAPKASLSPSKSRSSPTVATFDFRNRCARWDVSVTSGKSSKTFRIMNFY